MPSKLTFILKLQIIIAQKTLLTLIKTANESNPDVKIYFDANQKTKDVTMIAIILKTIPLLK